MNILLTGATGFIGSHLIGHILREHQVFCIVRHSRTMRLPTMAHPIELDLSTYFNPGDLPTSIDIIIHLAQTKNTFPENTMSQFVTNLASTQQLADYGKNGGVSRFIFASTGNVYQDSPLPLSEEDPVQVSDYYTFTKLTCEKLLDLYRQYFDVCILRLFTPYGYRQENRMIPKIIDLVQSRQPVILYNGGQPSITPIYIEDLISILLRAIQLKGSLTVNVGGDRTVSVREVAEIAGEAMGILPHFVQERNEKNWNLIANVELMKNIFSVSSLVRPVEGITRMIQLRNAAAQ